MQNEKKHKRPNMNSHDDAQETTFDQEQFMQLHEDVCAGHSPITLPPFFSHLIQDDQLKLLVKLARYKFVARMIKSTDTVLEVGSGMGIGSIFLGQHASHVTGLDVQEDLTSQARSINKRDNVTFECADLCQYTHPEKFDVAVSLDVIEHVPVEEGSQHVQALARHIKHDGMCIIGSPSIYSYQYQGADSRAAHVKCYDQKELTELVEKHFKRTLAFSMNDEVVHTGFSKLAWYYFVIAFVPRAE